MSILIEAQLTPEIQHRDSNLTRHMPDRVINVIAQQAEKPPGRDPYIGSFYSSFLDFINNGNPYAVNLINGVQERRSLTPELHTNLLFRAFQSSMLANPNYPQNYDNAQIWTDTLTQFFNEDVPEYQAIRKTLLEKDTSTTIYQRYAGERAIMAMLAQGNPVTVADIGCGGNYGLPGIELNEPFKLLKDNTPNQMVSNYIAEPFNIDDGIAIDLNNPYEADSIAWRHSCGVYPTELMNGELDRIKLFEQRLNASQKIGFKQANLLQLDTHLDLPFDKCDFVILNTMLYQLHSSEQKNAIQQARLLLKQHGVLFIQDFARKDPNDATQLQFSGVSWGEPNSCRLFLTNKKPDSILYEALRWNNGRCTEVTPGDDFSRINELHPISD